jgi:hypothetical protein
MIATRKPLKAISEKPKKCAVRACRAPFVPSRPFQTWCSPDCAVVIARAKQDKQRKALAQVERREIRARKEKLKTHGDYVQEATSAVQAYRRVYELSIGSGCISCGKSQAEIEAAQGWKTGGAWDGGHFLSKGARPELRLEEKNIWLQCKGCNGGSAKYARKGESVRNGFRAGLIERIGLPAVEALEADHRPRKYTIDELKQITAHYRALLRDLKKQQEG